MNRLLRARWVIPDAGQVLEGGALLLRDGGIAAVLSSAEARSASADERVDLGDVALTPGLVNAHAHLELSSASGLPGDLGFGAWIGAVLAHRARAQQADYDAGLLDGAQRLLASGTTAVGDVDSTGAAERLLPRTALRARVFREVLDGGDPARSTAQLARLAAPAVDAERVELGISPHGPHTVSATLLEACAARARSSGGPLQVHWAETEEEVRWLRDGGGPLAERLGASPRCSGLELLARHGLLGPRLSLVHGNHPGPGELELVAEAGATLVHCPGTHEFFGRAPLDLLAWRASGVTIALGTDSLASNTDLDLRLEMRRVRAAHPDLRPEEVFGWATRGGARALGLQDRIGELAVGKSADVVAFDATGVRGAADLLDRITSDEPAVRGSWVAGRPV